MLNDIFLKSKEELDLMFADGRLDTANSALWLIPNQMVKGTVVQGSDLILMFLDTTLVMYCERVQLSLGIGSREIVSLFKNEIKCIADDLHSRITSAEEYEEIVIYKKAYLACLVD